METTIENQTFALENINVKNLPELQGWKEKQQAIVKENPYIAISDNKSYAEGKKSRTALVSARTTIIDQDKLIASKLSDIRKQAGAVRDELIAITQPHEDKQQAEVKRYEAEKEAEKLAKEKAEQERIDLLKVKINGFYVAWKLDISELTLEKIDDFKIALTKELKETESWGLSEFEDEFNEKVVLLREQFKERVALLKVQEENRIENEKLAKERAEMEAEKAKIAAANKEREEKEAAARKIEQDKLQKERDELAAERKKLADAEAKRQAEIEAKRIATEKEFAKIEAEEKEKEEKKAQAARLKALQPEKKKAADFINSVSYTVEAPIVKDPVITELIGDFMTEIDSLVENYNNALNQIK